MNGRVGGAGPTTCDYMLVGSMPGYEEDRAGVPFVGKTGQELNRLLRAAGKPRDRWFLTNVHREYHGKDYEYSADETAVDVADLEAEFDTCAPSLVLVLGREALQVFLGSDVGVEDTHGLPWLTEYRGRALVVFVSYHPAAGFHSPDTSAKVAYDFAQLSAYLEGHIQARRLFDDPIPTPDYQETTEGPPEAARLAVDTEGTRARPYSVQWCATPGVARMAARLDSPLRAGTRLVFHNALHDLAMFREMGLRTDLLFHDTMVMAYLLCVEPQGLKALALRHCNMRMDSYEDLVAEPNARLANTYFQGLHDVEQLEWEARCADAYWTEIDKGRRITKVPSLPKTELHKAAARALRSKDSRALYGKWQKDNLGLVVDVMGRMGPLPEATLDHVPHERVVHYGCRDADATLRTCCELLPRVEAMGLRGVYDLELATYPLLERMQYVGFTPDLAAQSRLSARLGEELATLQTDLDTMTERPGFNANSGDQVSAFVFDQLGLEGVKKTSSGRYSSDDKVLEALQHEYPHLAEIGAIRRFRELYKLKHTFVDVVPRLVRGWPHDGRVHFALRTTRIPTGRLAATMPPGFPRFNMLAQPKHGEFAKDFRRGWIAGPGHLLAEWDLSQIELRVGAHLSQDEYMCGVYRGHVTDAHGKPIDLHEGLAHRIFGGSKEGRPSAQRTSAKAINFGFWMGQTAVGLMLELRKNGVRVDQDDAQRWLDEANATYSGAQPYKDRMIAEARQNGFVRCLSGRIRYIGGIRSRDERIRAEAERLAFSTPVQEGAQWIMKQAEAEVWTLLQEYWRRGRWVEPILQCHDALTLECEDDLALAHELNTSMTRIMTKPRPGFSLPIETSGDYGRNWADMEAFS